ncbi:MAG: hypothetical protein ABR540_22615 [Acidimicrobiales bacterium]
MARPNWLIRPEHEGGNYREMVRWVCGRCESIYPIRFRLREPMPGEPCPICGWTPRSGTRPATLTVWVRVAPSVGLRGLRDLGDVAAAGDPYDAEGEEGMTDDG